MDDYLKEKNLSTSSGGSDSKLSDREKQKAFIKYYNRLKKIAGDKEPIYFAECVRPQHQTPLVYGWVLKGVRKEIKTTGYQNSPNLNPVERAIVESINQLAHKLGARPGTELIASMELSHAIVVY